MLEGELVLLSAAGRVARELGGAIDDAAVILGPLQEDGPDGAGRRALEACGLTTTDLEQRRAVGDGAVTGAIGTLARVLAASAAGHALAEERTRPGASDVLTVVLWGDPTSSTRRWLEDAGVVAETLAAGLEAVGVALPDLPLPRWVDVEAGPRVVLPVERLGDVLEHVGGRIGAAYGWGWNIDTEDAARAWIQGEAAADLPALVGEVLREGTFEVRASEHATERIDERLLQGRA